jgi:enoyl-CoA hydratase/carnithine racemase
MGGTVPSAPIELPSSYASLKTTQITVSHIPTSSPTPTPVVLVTLNRPKNYNAFTKVMEGEVVRVFTMFDVDDRVRCVVLNGAGKMFCAGADLDIGFNAQKETVREGEHRDGFVILNSQSTFVC